MKRTLLAMIVVAAPIPALADEDERRVDPRRVELTAGLSFGDHGLGDYIGHSLGLLVQAGLKHDRYLVHGEYSFFSHHGELADGDVSGLLHRVSANLRADLGGATLTDGSAALWLGTWVEAGVGYQLFQWDTGGTVGRNDVSIALGGGCQLGRKHKHAGLYYSVRVMFAPVPEDDGATARCQEPCFDASAAKRTDVGATFSILFPFSI